MGGLSLVAVRGLLIAVASVAAELRLQGAGVSVVVTLGLQRVGLVVMVHGIGSSVACGIFLDQELNLCPLH